MNYRFHIILSFIFILFASEAIFSQVTVSKSEVDYSIKIEKDSILRILTFWKDKDSTIYTSVKYSVSDFNNTLSEKNLEDEINAINQLWEIAKDSITFNLQSFNIGYPMYYSDILKNQANAFINSEKWKNHTIQYGKTLDVNLIRNIMLEQNVYEPLNEFLNNMGYRINGFDTEKHGFVQERDLQKTGLTGSEIVPMPFIVWVKLNALP